MESVKKWLSERNARKNGLYLHYSTPKLLDVVSAAQLRQWARGGAASKLERAVLAGQGRRLLAEAEALPLSTHLPTLVAKCDALHAAIERGSLLELQELLDSDYNRRKYIQCRDEAGVGLLHKAIYYDFMDIAEWLVTNYPQLVHQRDSLGRTPLHYTAVCRDGAAAAALLERAGAVKSARDAAGHTPAYYRTARNQLTLPVPPDKPPEQNGQSLGLVIKRSNIRIWCHDCDMQRLQRVVWEGHGAKLLSEVSNQPAVKKFLEAVPYIMNTIKEIHTCVIRNDLETLMKLTGDPVPPQILSGRDSNNMTVTHKAAGLGHGGILGYIVDRYPQGINDVDNEGRTPLHYAAGVRDDQHMYNTLVGLGADEGVVDNKNRTPGYYINRPQELDKNMLKTLPDAPRTASSAYPPSWDWKILDMEAIVELNKKSRRKNIKVSNENISSKNNSTSISENTKSYRGGMKVSNTQEYIKELPDLNDNRKRQIESIDLSKDSEAIENSDESKNDKDINKEELSPGNEDIKDEEEKNGPNTDDGQGTQEITEDSVDEDKRQEESVRREEKKSVEIEEEDNEHEGENHLAEYEDEGIEKEDKEIEQTHETEETHEPDENPNSNEPEQETDDHKKSHTEEDEQESIDMHESGKDQENVNGHEENVSEENETNDAEEEKTSNNEGIDSDGRNTQESIEGIISGEAEQDTQDASITQRDDTVEGDILVVESDIDPEVAELINTANMEMLATLVLNGEGSRLVGRRSINAELQAFLDNVPTYMQKINKVHLAAKEGNLRDLQAALDRRKFAIARDPISPNGATPLHMAVVFGKTNILKYLGGRFPETLSAVDFEGRTALHYAAALPDNGHYYYLLQQLGANSKDLDDNGQSAEDYFKNPTLFPYSRMLSDFGITEEEAQQILSDKGPDTAANGHMNTPAFKTDEGRYLAKSLGDPLIKGLTEVANVKPKDPVAFLASFLHNFPDKEKTQLGTQESNIMVTKEAGEVENEQPPPKDKVSELSQLKRSAARTATRPHRPIDVVVVDPQQEVSPDGPEAAFSSINRDEHGQSMLHFAAARTHTRNALFQLLQESDISIGYRDELYRTARDVSIQANITDNTVEIDRFVLHLAARGNTQKIMELLMEGYDHILDIIDEEGVSITEVISQRGDEEMGNLLASIPAFEESRETLHGAIRRGDLKAVQESITAEGGRTLARGQNYFGRTALHVAVLTQHEDVVAYLAETCPELLRIGDNLERTPLHYAMGVEKIESLSRILIRAGSKRVLKDLKGRQPSYYFMNKSDILRLKEEEEVY